jgi:hypothetical protein
MLATTINSVLTQNFRSYSLLKSERGDVERYLTCITSVSKLQALARFRMGFSLLRVETGRYEIL